MTGDRHPWWFHYVIVGAWLVLAVVAAHGALGAPELAQQAILGVLAVVFTAAAALWTDNVRREVPADD